MKQVCLLGFGEVGSTLCQDLLQLGGIELTAWDAAFDNPESPANQNFDQLKQPLLTKAGSATEAVADADLVISAVTAQQAVAAADSVLDGLRPETWYLELNSVSPGTKAAISARVDSAGGQFVEAAVMSPIAPKRIATSILLAGPSASVFLLHALSLGFTGMRVLSDTAGQAAASKMCRSVIVKGTEALITEALLSARHYGVEQTVLESLSDLFPDQDWHKKARYMISRSVLHGVRRAEEMTEVAKTVQETNGTPWMSESCVARQQWAGALPKAIADMELNDMLDALDLHAGSRQSNN